MNSELRQLGYLVGDMHDRYDNIKNAYIYFLSGLDAGGMLTFLLLSRNNL